MFLTFSWNSRSQPCFAIRLFIHNTLTVCLTLGVYGDVVRVKIMFNKKDTALIQFNDSQQAVLGKLNHQSTLRLCLAEPEFLYLFAYRFSYAIPEPKGALGSTDEDCHLKA